MSKEARIGSLGYWEQINSSTIFHGMIGTGFKTDYGGAIQELGARAHTAIAEIHQDLEDRNGQIRCIPVSDRNALIMQLNGLHDICEMAGISDEYSSDCILALNSSIFSPWAHPFRDEVAIDSAVSMIKDQSHYSSSEILALLKDASKWSISFAAGSDSVKQAFLERITQGKDSSFLKDVADEYINQSRSESFVGRCGYSIGSWGYLSHFETEVFGRMFSATNSTVVGNPNYKTLLRENLQSIADQIEKDLDEAIQQNDYITDETANDIKSVLEDLDRCGINVTPLYRKVEKLARFVGGDRNAILKLQQGLNTLGNHLTEDGVFGEKTLDALNDFYDELLRGTFPTLTWVDPLQSAITKISVRPVSTENKTAGEVIYASFHDTSARSKNIKRGENRGVTVFRADLGNGLPYHINTVEGRSIKVGKYEPSSAFQQRVINKVNHTFIDERTYRFLKDFDLHAKKVRVAGRVLAITGAALDVLEIAETIYLDLNDADRKIGKSTYSSVASIGGSWAIGAIGAKGGAMLGASIGTAILPGIGTAVGGAVGGLALGIVGSYSGSKFGEYIIDVTETE